MANFYQQHPGLQNEFAQAGAQHDNGGSAPASATPSASPTPPMEFNVDYSAPQQQQAPDPSAGMPQQDQQPQAPRMTEVSNPWSISGAPMDVPAGHQWNPFSISGYSGGGTVGYDAGGDVDGDDLDTALQAVQEAFDFGKQKHGLGGGQQQASAIPAAPGNQSDSGAPRPLPMPGPLPPTSNPFGKRNNPFPAGKVASAMPSAPGGGGDSPRPQPMPGPLPPTANPFGKRNNPFPAGKTSENDNDADDEAA